MAVTYLFIFRMDTLVELTSQGVSFKVFPLNKKLRLISTEDIASLSITNHKWWHGFGYRYSLSGARIFAMKPGRVLKLVTKSGKKFLFGINREHLVKRFIQEEWPNMPFNVE